MLKYQDYIQSRNELIRTKYKELRGQKISRTDAFETMEKEFELSPHTLESITSRRGFQQPKPTKQNT